MKISSHQVATGLVVDQTKMTQNEKMTQQHTKDRDRRKQIRQPSREVAPYSGIPPSRHVPK